MHVSAFTSTLSAFTSTYIFRYLGNIYPHIPLEYMIFQQGTKFIAKWICHIHMAPVQKRHFAECMLKSGSE